MVPTQCSAIIFTRVLTPVFAAICHAFLADVSATSED